MNQIDRHLEASLLRQRGNNHALAVEVLKKLSVSSKERLFRLLQAMEHEIQNSSGKLRRYGLR